MLAGQLQEDQGQLAALYSSTRTDGSLTNYVLFFTVSDNTEAVELRLRGPDQEVPVTFRVMKRLYQGHLHPKLEIPRLTRPGGRRAL